MSDEIKKEMTDEEVEVISDLKPKKKSKPKEKYPCPDGFPQEKWDTWCDEAKRRYMCAINNEKMF